MHKKFLENLDIAQKLSPILDILVSDPAGGHQYVPQLENLLQGLLVHPAAVHSRNNSYFTHPAHH
jgi:hypothetical protein